MKNKLSEICFGITDGSHNPPKSGEKSEYLMLSSKNVYDDQITFEDPRYLSEEQFVSENRRTNIKPGDVLMTIVGTVGRTAVVKEGTLPITLQRSVAVLHPNTDICSSRYLMYLLRSKRSFFEAEAHGVAQKGIYLKQLSDVKVTIPEIAKQHEVVTILDKTSEVIHAREAEMEALDDLIKARFVEMFGAYNSNCCSKRIGDYAQILGGYAFKSDEFIQDAVPVIRISNINDGQVVPDYSTCYEETFWENNPKYRALSGDILMAMSGATTGKAGILRSSMKLLVNQRVACIRAKEGVSTSEYIYAVTQMPWMYDLIQEQSAGCAQPNISGKQIENMPIPEATYGQQKEFSAFVAQVDKSKVAVQKSLDETQLLFDSLMQEYFG